MKFKQVLAGLLVGAMVVTSAPVSGLGALSALAADEGGSTETKKYAYTKLTKGLTASADCGNGRETPDPMVIVDGKEDTYWRSADEGDKQPERHAEVQMNSKNNIFLTLSDASAVKKLEYVSKGKNENGTIRKCNIYYKTSAENADFQKVQEDPYTLDFKDNNQETIEFKNTLDDVKEIKIEVLNTAGKPTDMFISGHELYIYSDENTKVDSKKITPKAECSSQKGRGIKNLVDNNETSIYHSSWFENTGNVEDGEGFNEVVRPGTTTISTELVSRNNLYINLSEAKTVGKLTYLPRQGSGDGYENGRITEADIYVSNSDAEDASTIADSDWKKVETAKWKDDEDEKEVTFSPEMAKHIRIEVKHSAGNQADTYISAAEIGVYEATEEAGTPAEEYTALPASALKGTADSVEMSGESGGTQGKAEQAVDGKEDTYWHSQYNPSNNVVLNQNDPTKNENNNYYVELDAAYTVSEVTYLPRTKDGQVMGNGYITKCNVYTSKDKGVSWEKARESGEWTYTGNDVKKTITFEKPVAGVTNIKFEVLSTKGVSNSNDNKFIHAAEFGVIGKKDAETPPVSEDKVIKAPVLTAVAPVKGAKPADVTAAGAEGYTVKTAWTDSTGGAVTTFEAGKDYTLTATLTATEGYKFTETSKPSTIKVGEGDVDVTADIKDGGKTMTLTHKFTVPAETVQYAKLTGLTGAADSQELTGEPNGNGPIAKALDGDLNTYWHTNWKDGSAPKAKTDGTKLTGNNNYIITLAKPSTVTSVTYVPRNGYDSSSGKVNNGAIEQCKVYVTTDGTTWKLAGTIGENNAWSYVNKGAAGADQNFVEKTVTFDKAYADVTKVKIEAIKTAGPQPNEFINAAEFGVIGKGDGTPGEVTCNCALSEITGVQDQTVELDVADSKSVKLKPTATATPCRVDGHDGKVVYTYAVKDPGKTGATVTTDGTVTVKDAGTAVITVTATLAPKGKEALVKKKDVILTVKSNKASAAEKKELQDEVDSVAGQIADKDNYTEESYQKLKDAVDAAKSLINSGTASKQQIAEAKAAIAAAKSGLITKTAAAKKKLGDLLDEVAKLDKKLYTAESYNAMVAADEAAVKAYNKADATEEELTKAYNALKAAQDKLVFKLDQAKKEAAKALEAAKAIYDAGQKDYDDASWKAFSDAYNALKNAGEKADAAALTTLIGALTKAQGALTVKKAETPKPEVKLAAPAVKEVKAKAAKGGVTVTVTVEPVKDAAAYDVYRVVKGKAVKVGTTAAGKTAVTDTTAIRGASYYAVAVSADGKTVSEAGAAVAVKLAKAPKIKKASAGTKSVKLTWKKAKGTKVVVYRSTKKNSGYKKAATSRKGAASLVNKKVKAGKTYYYKIATVKGKTVSAMSKAKKVKIKK